MGLYSPKLTTLGANVNDGGNTAWSTVTNIYSDNASYATVAVANNTQTSQVLRATTFGFAIPSTKTIVGILVTSNCFGSSVSSGAIRDSSIKLTGPNTGGGANKADAVDWATSTSTVKTWGGVADMWGTSLTYADINDPTFGVDIKVTNTHASSSRTASVDYVQIDIYYTPIDMYVSQVNSEAWYTTNPEARVTQVGLELWRSSAYDTIPVYVNTLNFEAAYANRVATVNTLVTEVLRPALDPNITPYPGVPAPPPSPNRRSRLIIT